LRRNWRDCGDFTAKTIAYDPARERGYNRLGKLRSTVGDRRNQKGIQRELLET
jgi:hypothetical protein